ncbi:MAG: phosphoribosylamine--glycine ligase [Ignavibacteriaceae bacterium]
MNVLLIGSGGRESAIAYKLSSSKSLTKLFIAPGNPGTKKYGENILLNINDHNEVLSFCGKNNIKLVVIGPEKNLVEGLGDSLRKNSIRVFGPDSKAAEIEASKTFSKSFMMQFNIPTAAYREFGLGEIEIAKEYLQAHKYPCVIKADGLAAGKGVLICNNFDDAEKALQQIFVDKIFGESGNKLIVEEFMTGEEASVFAITDGENFVCLPSAQDHKRIGDNDTGKNTGGMGAYSPAPVVTPEIQKETEEKIIIPALKGMNQIGRKFVGCLYCGLMISAEGVKVVEFNCRFGDPETQAVLPLLKGDFLRLLYSAAEGKLEHDTVQYSGGSAVCVIAASDGYPDQYESGFEITGLNNAENDEIIVFHAGTKEINNKIVTVGGRVLGVTSIVEGNDLKAAKEKAYNALDKIKFEGIYYRKDIADKALDRS